MKKKKDGLIKGMIAAAIIFVVGFILTVCFGAYLGADAVRHIASGETFEEFVEERFPTSRKQKSQCFRRDRHLKFPLRTAILKLRLPTALR